MGTGIKAGILLGRRICVLGQKPTKSIHLVSISDASPHCFKLLEIPHENQGGDKFDAYTHLAILYPNS